MPPVLKVLSLITTILCVVLIFGVFVLDDHITYVNRYPQFSYKRVPRHTSQPATSTQDVRGQKQDIWGATATSAVIELTDNGTHLRYTETSTTTVDVASLERLGGNFYKVNTDIYYVPWFNSSCGETTHRVATKLQFSDSNKITEAKPGNFLTDGKEVSILFYKLTNIDVPSFSFVGTADYTSNVTDKTTVSWYKDKSRVLLFRYTLEECKGERSEEVLSTWLQEIDTLTFEYIVPQAPDSGYYYAKDKNYFYNIQGRISEIVTPKNCTGDFYKECLPKVQSATSSPVTTKAQ